MNAYDVPRPGPSYNCLDWHRDRPAGSTPGPVSEQSLLPSTSRDLRNFDRGLKCWNYYILESESSQSSDEGSETTLSIQGKETDRARDTSDLDSDEPCTLEFEVVSSDEKETSSQFVDSHQSSDSEDGMVEATVIRAVLTEGDFMFADSEDSLTAPSIDSELSPFDYWHCAQCRNTNNNPMFRYCEKCYKVRKDFFPPPPKHKRRKNRKRSKKLRKPIDDLNVGGVSSVDMRRQSEGTGLDFQSIKVPDLVKSNVDKVVISPLDSESSSEEILSPNSVDPLDSNDSIQINMRKRKNECLENHIDIKKLKTDLFDISVIKNNVNKNIILSESYNAQTLLNIGISSVKDPVSFSQPFFSEFDCVEPVSKSMSDPAMKFSKDDMDVISGGIHNFSDNESNLSLAKTDLSSIHPRKTLQSLSKDNQSDMCITCLVEPKSGVFVHGRIAHICCCYKCSVKVWMKTKRCPICNCKVSNVLKAFVM